MEKYNINTGFKRTEDMVVSDMVRQWKSKVWFSLREKTNTHARVACDYMAGKHVSKNFNQRLCNKFAKRHVAKYQHYSELMDWAKTWLFA